MKISIQINLQLIFLFFALSIPYLPFAQTTQDSLFSANDKIVADSIKIIGNEITEEYIILRELTFEIGDSVTSSSLQFNRERIFSLGLFSKVNIFPKQNNSNTIIIIEVSETWFIYPIPFIRSDGSKERKYTYGINLTMKNFRGRNEDLKAIIGFGYDPFAAIIYDNPAIDFENALGLSFSFVFVNANNKSSAAKKLFGSNFKNKFYSFNVTSYKRLNQFNLIFGQIGFDYIKTPEKIFSGSSASGSNIDRTISLGAGYIFDSRDLKQFADNGLSTSIHFRHKGFGINNINYNILKLNFRQYQRLFEPLNAKWKAALRHTFGSRIPYYDYSYLGYDEYVRGHSQNIREGNNYLIASVEFSYPIVKEFDFKIKLPLIPERLTSARIGIFITAFADAGNSFGNKGGIRLKEFYSGYGLGITFLILPFNAIRFEFAVNDKRKTEFLIGSGFAF
jgi:outer membrane protein assembly factor BamA